MTAGVPSWPAVVGDVVTTEAGGVATVSSPSMGRVEIRQNTRVRLEGGHVELEQGAVGSNRSAVRLGAVRVEARDRDASSNWFVVANREGRRLIAAHRGDVWIRGAGVAPLLLPAGSYAVPAAPQGSESTQDSEKKDRRKKGGAATAGAAAGWTIGSLSHAASIAIVAGVGAGAAAGAAVGFTGSSDPAPVRSESAP